VLVRGSNPRASENSASALRRISAAGSTMRSAASVGTMVLPERTSSGSPESSRRRLSAADTAGWCMPRRMAALDTLRSVSTVCKTLMRWRSILSKRAWSLIVVCAFASYAGAYAGQRNAFYP